MSSDWTETFYDAVKHKGSSIYIQAEVPWNADLSWVQAAKDFARAQQELQHLLKSYEGELKSEFYFQIIESSAIRSYGNLIDRMYDGPRVASISIYDFDKFKAASMDALNVSDDDVERAKDIRQSVKEHLATEVIKTSPISDLQNRVRRAGISNYEPVLKADEFDASKIARKHKHLFSHVAVVAARTHAVFGNLKELETDPSLQALVARKKLEELLRMNRAFDRDFENSLVEVLAGLYELEVGTYSFGTRRAHVREESSKDYAGIQVADIASAIARRYVQQYEQGTNKITSEALEAINANFYKTFYNGIKLI